MNGIVVNVGFKHLGLKVLLYGLVPDNTLHMVTSKRHKTEKKIHFVVHVSPSVFGIKEQQ